MTDLLFYLKTRKELFCGGWGYSSRAFHSFIAQSELTALKLTMLPCLLDPGLKMSALSARRYPLGYFIHGSDTAFYSGVITISPVFS
jgi:hypothetical protein